MLKTRIMADNGAECIVQGHMRHADSKGADGRS